MFSSELSAFRVRRDARRTLVAGALLRFPDPFSSELSARFRRKPRVVLGSGALIAPGSGAVSPDLVRRVRVIPEAIIAACGGAPVLDIRADRRLVVGSGDTGLWTSSTSISSGLSRSCLFSASDSFGFSLLLRRRRIPLEGLADDGILERKEIRV